MEEYKYPMWFKLSDSQLVVMFDGLNSGEVVKGDDIYMVGGSYMNCWVSHTDENEWIDVTDQYKPITNEAPKCQYEISFDDECIECDKLNKLYNRPKVSHYQSGGIEPIDYINSHNMNFNCGCVVKYITRNGKKDGECPIKDLKKAIDYINFEIERLENVQK